MTSSEEVLPQPPIKKYGQHLRQSSQLIVIDPMEGEKCIVVLFIYPLGADLYTIIWCTAGRTFRHPWVDCPTLLLRIGT